MYDLSFGFNLGYGPSSGGGYSYSNYNPFNFGSQSVSSPGGPATSNVQQTFPTSAYGQTIPVIYGKARVPLSYIWAPAINVQINGSSVRVLLTARLRVAKPLVTDSTWGLRRLWADGKLIYDASTGYRQAGLNFAFYDGRSTQGRDPTQVAAQGTDNVSAHRGYIDILVKDFDLGTAADAPAVFEAEVVQGATTSASAASFTTYFNDAINTYAAGDWQNGAFYGYSTSIGFIRRFSIGTATETYAVAVTPKVIAFTALEESSFRYIPEIDRLLALIYNGSAPYYAALIDPVTGVVTAEDTDAMSSEIVGATGLIQIGDISIFLVTTAVSDRLSIAVIGSESVSRTYLSGAGWNGHTAIRCITPGAVRADDADVYFCADDKVVKAKVSSGGALTGIETLATLVDDPVYAVYYNSGLIVWTDSAEVKRINLSTGATEWTVATPYTLVANPALRGLANPDQNNFIDKFFVQELDAYNFTDLSDGSTAEISKGSEEAFRGAYDALSNTVIQTDNATKPLRTRFDVVGSGSTWNLSDFIEALYVSGSGFAASEIIQTGISDTIEGAVIDVSSGVRDINRAVAEPYSISIFERAGVVINKRANTDGSFAVDAALTIDDFADRAGQAIRARKLNPEEFSNRYGINYRDPDEIYQPRPQYGEIPTVPFPLAPANRSIKADIPIIVDADTVRSLATKKINRLNEERHEFSFRLKAEFADLEPEDIITFPFASRTITARIVETTLQPDFSIEVKCTEFLSKVDVTISGGTGNPTEPQPVGSDASRYYHLDIPLLADTHDTSGASLVQYHVLASQGQTYWDGAILYRQDSQGLYVPVDSEVTDGLVGVALDALPDTDNPYVTEFTRTFNVAFISGDKTHLATKTYLEVMNGANMFAIGQPGRWEVCHVITITANANGSYTFEGIVRGRGVSEEHTGTHAVGDLVIWLGDNVDRQEYTIASLDSAFNYKAVGRRGGTLAGTVSVSRTVTGEAEKIPKPCQLDAVIDGSDIDLSWVRRGRIGVIWDDDGDFMTPLGESLEQYVVRIKDGPGGTVLRTVTVDDLTAYTYAAADITTDFGSMPASLTYDIRQVSGTGVVCPTREATIEL